MKPSTDMVGWTETNHRVAGTYGENVLFSNLNTPFIRKLHESNEKEYSSWNL